MINSRANVLHVKNVSVFTYHRHLRNQCNHAVLVGVGVTDVRRMTTETKLLTECKGTGRLRQAIASHAASTSKWEKIRRMILKMKK